MGNRSEVTPPTMIRARFIKRYIQRSGIEVLASVVGLALTLLLFVNFDISKFPMQFYWQAASMLAIVAWGASHLVGMYRVDSRYFGIYDLFKVFTLGIVLTVTCAILELKVFPDELPVGMRTLALPILFGLFSMAIASGIRIFRRRSLWQRSTQNTSKPKAANKTLIVGAGESGEMVLRQIFRRRRPLYDVVGFVDDDPQWYRLNIHGVPVLGSTKSIPQIVAENGVNTILLALPNATGDEVRRIMGICNATPAAVLTLPLVQSALDGKKDLSLSIREVDIEDLLRRKPVQTNIQDAADYLGGETVVVTGGGGSIGSELARQVAQLSPATLILIGKGENSLYEIQQELIQTTGIIPVAIVADVRDQQSIKRIFAEYKPTVVFHAAAHKHVPLMQSNPIEAVRNNVFGTYNIALQSAKGHVKKFIYISTDKAVRPSSIMGATKRIGEFVLEMLAQQYDTEFATVRFGNVLGSRGSLIPLLKAQIKRGGPVTVTHKDMTRFFMTIPEAVQLILQAGAMGRNGEVFILDMGDPIKIMDLAQDLIRLHGLVVDQDIQIAITGMRPGEKLHEELVYGSEQLSGTKHDKIRVVKQSKSSDYEQEWLQHEMATLEKLCDEGKTDEVQQRLMTLAWGKTTQVQVPMPPVSEQDPSQKPQSP